MKKKTLNCKDVYNKLCNSLDEDLNSPRCLEIKRHLSDCPNCKAYLDSLKKTITLYREYPKPKLPKIIHKKLLRNLKLQILTQKK